MILWRYKQGELKKKKWGTAHRFEYVQLFAVFYMYSPYAFKVVFPSHVHTVCIDNSYQTFTCLLALVKRFVIIVLFREPAGIGRVVVGRRRPVVAALSQLPCTISRQEAIVQRHGQRGDAHRGAADKDKDKGERYDADRK